MTPIPIQKIILNPEQPRKTFDPVTIQEMAQTIQEVGLQQFITVEDNCDGSYTLVDGQRRVEAHKLLGRDQIEANIRERTNHGGRELLIGALIANIQREDMNPVDQARAYKRLQTVYGMKPEDIARKCGKHSVIIYNALTLLKLEAEILELIMARKLSHNSKLVHQILRVPGEKVRIRLAQQLSESKATLEGKIISATRVADALTAPKLKKADAPVLQMVQEETGQLMDEEHPPERWDALVELNMLPPWEMTVKNARQTCDQCGLRDVANKTTCVECPLICFLKLSIRRAQ